MTEELKPLPCPFCNSKPEVRYESMGTDYSVVVCPECLARGPESEPESAAIKAWNTRSPAWRDIESAPRDGFEKPVLVWNGFWRGVAWYDADMREGERWVAEDGAIVGPQPTHWMPLPLPPEEKA